MRLTKWQRAAIDGELNRLRLKYRDPQTLRAAEGVRTEFHREYKQWCEAQDWMVDYDRIAIETRRDNVERLSLPTNDEGFPEFYAQSVLPLDMEGCLTIIAADARQPDLQEHIQMRQSLLDSQVAAGTRYILGMREHASRFRTLDEKWLEVQQRPSK